MYSPTRSVSYRRVARALAAAALVLALAGCFVQESRKREADAEANAAYAQCETLRHSGKYKTELAAVDCAVPTVVAAYEQTAYPFNDLIYISIQARRIGAAKVDAGIVTEAQYRHDLAVLDARLAAEDKRRRGVMEYGGNPQPTPVSVLTQGLPAFAPAPTVAALPLGAKPGCVPLGDIRRCK